VIEGKLEGRAAYIKLDGEILKTERELLEDFHLQLKASIADIIIIDVGRCRMIEEQCLRPLIQMQACIRSRPSGNVFIIGASNRLKESLLKKGAVRAQETYENLSLIKNALAA